VFDLPFGGKEATFSPLSHIRKGGSVPEKDNSTHHLEGKKKKRKGDRIITRHGLEKREPSIAKKKGGEFLPAHFAWTAGMEKKELVFCPHRKV